MPACMQHAYFIRMEYTYRHRYTLGVLVVLDSGQIMPKMRLANARYISREQGLNGERKVWRKADRLGCA